MSIKKAFLSQDREGRVKQFQNKLGTTDVRFCLTMASLCLPSKQYMNCWALYCSVDSKRRHVSRREQLFSLFTVSSKVLFVK